MVEEAFQHLLSAVETPERLTEFARRLRVLVRADAAAVRFVNTRTWRSLITGVCGNAPLSPEFFAAYDKDYAKTDAHVRVAMRKTLPRGHIYFCHEHYPIEMRSGDTFFQFLASRGVAWTAGYMAQLSECEAVGFCAVRGPEKPPFGDQERERLQSIALVLRDWGKAFWFARRTAAAVRAAQRALEMRPDGAICLDEERRPLWQNHQIDLSALGLQRFNGRIRAVSPADERSLTDAIARAIDYPAGPGTTVKMSCGRVAICGDGGGPAPHAALLSWGDSRRVAAVGPPDRATKAEKETFDLLVGGLSPNEIAQRRGVRISTVRTHIKRLYRRLGVHNLAQLLAKAHEPQS